MLTDIIGRGVDYYYKTSNAQHAPPDRSIPVIETSEYTLSAYVYSGGRSASSGAPEAVLALFYGGGWHHGNHWQLAVMARDLARKGMTVYLPEYRVASKHKTSAADARNDVEQFYCWLNDRHPDSSVFFGGSSAGGFLAATVGLRAERKPKGIVLLNPALNLDRRSVERSWALFGQPAGFSVEDLLGLDPIHFVNENSPPTIIMHGTRDFIVPIKWVKEYAATAKEAGNACELVPFPGYPHAFTNRMLFPKAHDRAVSLIVEFIGSVEVGSANRPS